MNPHRIVTPPGLAEPRGYAHAVVAEPGRLVHLGGQTAQGSDGTIRGRRSSSSSTSRLATSSQRWLPPAGGRNTSFP